MGRGGLPAGNESGKEVDMRSRMWAGVGIRRKQRYIELSKLRFI